MDSISHLVIGGLISLFFGTPDAKIAVLIGSLIPDLSLIPIYFYRGLEWIFSRRARSLKHRSRLRKLIKNARLFAHSFLILIPFLVLAIIFQSEVIFAFTIGYFSHLLFDLPTHKGRMAIQPLFPLYRFEVQGYISWCRNRTILKIILPAWALSFVLFILIILQ